MKKIICNLNLFAMNSPVFILDTETGNLEHICDSALSLLPTTLSALSADKQIPKVCLSGNKQYGDKLAKDILEYSKTNYSENIIEIEVI